MCACCVYVGGGGGRGQNPKLPNKQIEIQEGRRDLAYFGRGVGTGTLMKIL